MKRKLTKLTLTNHIRKLPFSSRRRINSRKEKICRCQFLSSIVIYNHKLLWLDIQFTFQVATSGVRSTPDFNIKISLSASDFKALWNHYYLIHLKSDRQIFCFVDSSIFSDTRMRATNSLHRSNPWRINSVYMIKSVIIKLKVLGNKSFHQFTLLLCFSY
jgi:hypothetical protein